MKKSINLYAKIWVKILKYRTARDRGIILTSSDADEKVVLACKISSLYLQNFLRYDGFFNLLNLKKLKCWTTLSYGSVNLGNCGYCSIGTRLTHRNLGVQDLRLHFRNLGVQDLRLLLRWDTAAARIRTYVVCDHWDNNLHRMAEGPAGYTLWKFSFLCWFRQGLNVSIFSNMEKFPCVIIFFFWNKLIKHVFRMIIMHNCSQTSQKRLFKNELLINGLYSALIYNNFTAIYGWQVWVYIRDNFTSAQNRLSIHSTHCKLGCIKCPMIFKNSTNQFLLDKTLFRHRKKLFWQNFMKIK